MTFLEGDDFTMLLGLIVFSLMSLLLLLLAVCAACLIRGPHEGADHFTLSSGLMLFPKVS